MSFNMSFNELLNQRSAYNDYDKKEVISENVIKDLVGQAMQAPSAYHMQNVHFIAVTSAVQKNKLYDVSYHQDKVLTAPLTFIVCGDMNGYKNLEAALQPCLQAQQISTDILNSLVKGATTSHRDNPILRRDEAIRSASLASMVLMLAAENRAYATGPMSGFEPDELSKSFGLSATLIPVILVTIGTATSTPTSKRYSQKMRLPIADKLNIV